MTWNNERGSALIETLTSSLLVVTLVSLALTVLYLLFAKMWIQHVGYNGLLCTLQGQTSKICAAMVKDRLHSTLPIGTTQSVKFTPRQGGWRIYIHWKLKGYREIKYARSLRYKN